jgi:probable rRNA maturation factor
MNIYWDERGVKPLEDSQYQLLTKVIETCLDYALGCLPNARELSVSLVSNDEIHEINNQYRGIDGPTDVLSFTGMPVSLGDIVISTEKAGQQAKEYGHSLERELAFLTAHGMLHLLGYGHDSPEDEAEMFKTQDEILAKMGINR